VNRKSNGSFGCCYVHDGDLDPTVTAKLDVIAEAAGTPWVHLRPHDEAQLAQWMPDKTETRRVYRTNLSGSGYVLSGRVDDAAQFLPERRADLTTIASSWKHLNGFTRGSILYGVDRLLPRASNPPNGTDATEAMMKALQHLRNRDVVLALSGGIDSRTMMALLHGAGIRFQTITYGIPDMPDWQTARMVAERDGVEWTGIDVRELKIDIQTSVSETAVIGEGTYSVAHAAVIPTIAALFPNSVIVDGAFGGLLRGGMANSALVRGSDDLASGDVKRIEKWFTVEDLSVFHPDIQVDLADRARTALQQCLDQMPRFRRREGREWVDLFLQRHYVPGFVANPGRIYDRWFDSDMPYLNPDALAAVMALPARQRRHARLFRTWMNTFRPRLLQVPFVGKRTMVPPICAGNPWRTALWNRLGRRHRRADAGQIELGVRSLLSPSAPSSESEAELLALCRDGLVPFNEAVIQQLAAETFTQNSPVAAQRFYQWYSLALALYTLRS